MKGWLISWLPAGRNFVDRIVTLLPDDYDADEVEKILRALFNIGSLTFGEMVQSIEGQGVPAQLHHTRQGNGEVRLTIEIGSYTLEARRVRNLRVLPSADERETITWEESNYKGVWSAKSYTRTRTGSISFDIE